MIRQYHRGAGPTRAISHCGVTVTDWRLYTADHRQLDGGDPAEASSIPPDRHQAAPPRGRQRDAARDVSCQRCPGQRE